MKDRKRLSFELDRVSPDEYRDRVHSGLAVVLDNVRSAHNVGSAFRSCDAFGVERLWLCGICATPPSAEIHKSALGAEDSVPWMHSDDTLEAVRRLREEGWTVIAVEQTVHARMLEDFRPYAPGSSPQRFALVFGNEVDGVDQRVVDACDFCLEIPQQGSKHSLNVSVSIGILLWHFTSERLRNSAENSYLCK